MGTKSHAWRCATRSQVLAYPALPRLQQMQVGVPAFDACSGCRWGDLEFPLPFGRSMTSAEEYVHDLDGKTGASLKLSILNPKGRIWTMVAGGGASVIYAGSSQNLPARLWLPCMVCS